MSARKPVDLEISVKQDPPQYRVTLRTTLPQDSSVHILEDRSVPLQIAKLQEVETDVHEYGLRLSKALFADPDVKHHFTRARDASERADVPLRVRLRIDPEARAVSSLYWERLVDPRNSNPLAVAKNVYLSRFFLRDDFQELDPREVSLLRVLVAVANPPDLVRYGLAPLVHTDELNLARSAFDPLECKDLSSSGPVSLSNLGQALEEGRFDILYLVCHGVVSEGKAYVWLEKDDPEDSRPPRISAEEVVRCIGGNPQLRLVILSSCYSTGSGKPTGIPVSHTLGPQLVRAGVPAVLGMNGLVSVETAQTFMNGFLPELVRTSEVDRAVNVGRRRTREHRQEEWWAPSLYTRLGDGNIRWISMPPPAEERTFEQWPMLLEQVRSGRCTPILGPGLNESYVGTWTDFAHRLAEEFTFPMAEHKVHSFPAVARFIATIQGRDLLVRALSQAIKQEIRDRNPELLADIPADTPLDRLVAEVGRSRRSNHPAELSRVLAELRLPVYLTTDPFDSLADALREQGAEPVSEYCRWHDELRATPTVWTANPAYVPTSDTPLVFHITGCWTYPESLVLTEDDFEELLISIRENEDVLPPEVRRRLTSTALMIVGFHLESLDFRLLFRSLSKWIQANRGRSRRTHVAAQVEPTTAWARYPQDAQRYLEAYFRNSEVRIHWRSTNEFATELRSHLEGRR